MKPGHFYKTRPIEEWLRARERNESRVGGGMTPGKLLIKEGNSYQEETKEEGMYEEN